jgi:hypothetical protein
MAEVFDKYPSVEIVADAYEPQYRIKYIECVRSSGSIRFERFERIVPKDELEEIILRVIGRNG